jgi:DNA-binding response OmpR family regulator
MPTHTILIVEDDTELSRIIADILQAEGFATDTIHDGAAVYKRVAETRPDMVMLDLHLPNLSGPEILNQIRANPDLAQIKVLVATADVNLAKVVEPKADVVFQKPYSISQLVDVVGRLVQHQA